MPDPAAPPSFEAALADLEGVLRSLEDGGTSLDDALAAYEKGVGLLKACYAQLAAAELRIQQLSGVAADGTPVLAPFAHKAAVAAAAPKDPPF